jgi:hypothetical protein
MALYAKKQPARKEANIPMDNLLHKRYIPYAENIIVKIKQKLY